MLNFGLKGRTQAHRSPTARCKRDTPPHEEIAGLLAELGVGWNVLRLLRRLREIQRARLTLDRLDLLHRLLRLLS